MFSRIGALILVVGAVFIAGCSGGSPSGPDADRVIAIRGIQGTQSFAPNPLDMASGTFAWKNDDSVAHHLVFDDGSVDTGNLTPGASSSAFTVHAGTYHCAIHPTMVGSVNAAVPDGSTLPPDY